MTDDLPKRLRDTYARWNNPPSPELPYGARIVLEAADAIDALRRAPDVGDGPGCPDSVEIHRDESGVVEFQMYDAKGLSCGGAEFHPSGKVVWTLLRGDMVKSGKDVSAPDVGESVFALIDPNWGEPVPVASTVRNTEAEAWDAAIRCEEAALYSGASNHPYPQGTKGTREALEKHGWAVQPVALRALAQDKAEGE